MVRACRRKLSRRSSRLRARVRYDSPFLSASRVLDTTPLNYHIPMSFSYACSWPGKAKPGFEFFLCYFVAVFFANVISLRWRISFTKRVRRAMERFRVSGDEWGEEI